MTLGTPRFPLWDERGNALVSWQQAAEDPIAGGVGDRPMPLSLMVAVFRDAVLLVFDRRRRQWELPGGRIDPGETPERAARREFAEETGQPVEQVKLAGIAEFDIAPDRPHGARRQEFAAVYRGRIPAIASGNVPNEEISAVLLWFPGDALEGASPLDTRIAVLARGVR